MGSLLVGNGLIIQFGGMIYSNLDIIKRTMINAKQGRYEDDMKKTLSPDEAHQFFVLFRQEISKTSKTFSFFP